MRNLIKKILKEETEWFEDAVNNNIYTPKVGDTFYIPKHNYSVRIKSTYCDEDYIPQEKKEYGGDEWGVVSYMDYGCIVYIETNEHHGIWRDSDNREGVNLGWVQVLIDKKYWVQEKNMNEQEEDFGWLDLPELPEGDSYEDKVRYALLNTEFELRLEDNRFYIIWLNNGGNSGAMVNHKKDRFTPEIMIPELKKVVDHHKGEWYQPFYEKLYNILIQIK